MLDRTCGRERDPSWLLCSLGWSGHWASTCQPLPAPYLLMAHSHFFPSLFTLLSLNLPSPLSLPSSSVYSLFLHSSPSPPYTYQVAPLADLSLSRSCQVHRSHTTGPGPATTPSTPSGIRGSSSGSSTSKASTAVLHRPPRPSTPNPSLTPSPIPRSSSFAHGEKGSRRLHGSQGRVFNARHSKLMGKQRDGGAEERGDPKVPASPAPSTESSASASGRKGAFSPWGFSVRSMFKSASAPQERAELAAGEESPRKLLTPSLWRTATGGESLQAGGNAEPPAGFGEKGVEKEGLQQQARAMEQVNHEELHRQPRRGRKGFNSMFGLDR